MDTGSDILDVMSKYAVPVGQEFGQWHKNAAVDGANPAVFNCCVHFSALFIIYFSKKNLNFLFFTIWSALITAVKELNFYLLSYSSSPFDFESIGILLAPFLSIFGSEPRFEPVGS